MNKLIDFFLKNVHLNHLLLLFLLISGIFAYSKIPKELFPDIVLDKIMVSGNYAGSSANNLDKMAVRDIEDDISSISGISEIESIITPGVFTIILTLDDNVNASRVLDKVKDSIASIRQNLPSDMNEPIAKQMDKTRDLMKISVASDKLSFDELLEEAKSLRRYLLRVKDISEIEIYGDSDKKIELKINEEALRAYKLNPADVIGVIRNLSYIYPIGDIDDASSFIFVSTINGKSTEKEWENTLLHVSNKYLYLGDIATVKIYHPQDDTLGSFNAQASLTLAVKKDEVGNSIQLSKILHKKLEEYNKKHTDIKATIYLDSSKPIKNRLNVIISNLTLGLVLIFISMFVLINKNTAIIVTLGIPFSFIIGLLFLYFMGYSLNVVSLIGALLVVGIAVDDAVVVSENIQRHIDEGMEPEEAAKVGAKEMMFPVVLATMTTVVAFMPMFMMGGEMGLFIKLIPIVVIMVLLGSLIESFLFLPLHAKSMLKKGTPSRDWTWLNNHYESLLHKLLHHKKLTLLFFFVFVPLATVMTLKNLHFQFFPSFDNSKLYISAKLDINTKLEDSFKIAREVEKEVLKYKDDMAIKSVSQVSGKRRNLANSNERGANLFYITIELEDMVDTNFVNRYINPILNLSFEFNDPKKIRHFTSFKIADMLREKLKGVEEKFPFVEFAVMEGKVGLVKTDIEVNLVGNNNELTQKALTRLKDKLASIKGTYDIVDNVRLGKIEYKIKIDAYGEQLGLSEGYVASILSSYFLGNRKAMSFDDSGVVQVTTEFEDKDHIDKLLNFNIPLGGENFIALKDVAEFIQVQDYERIEKDNGDIVKTVSANVDKSIITAIDVINQLQDEFKDIEKSGIRVVLKGEDEKNKQLKSDMKRSLAVAMFLMLILLLLIFPKIKYALMILSVIPFSIFGGLIGHLIVGMNLAMPSIIGMLGLAGVVINDGIIMLDFLHGTHSTKDFYYRAKLRLRPIIITSVTTFLGLSTLIFFATGQAKIMQPLAISLGFGLLWGTVMNLLYLPTLYALVNKIKPE
jgi:multidrug efflux pump subunit AcrB